MTERVILLDGIDPVVMFGPNNRLLEQIQGYFPKIKLVARGNEIKLMGESEEVIIFADKISVLLDYYRHYNRLDENDLERLLLDDDHMRTASNGEFEDALVFGTSGRPVRARTVNQLLLVKEYSANDLIIAEGPAGTGKTYTAIALA
ncbi:MAG: PhoH family protein, partial [Bacteroidales bacterium]